MPRPVIDTVFAHLQLEATIGGYEAAAEQEEALARVYTILATLIGARPDEIAFTENATRAFDLAFFALRFEPGDRILVGANEYISHYLAYRSVACRHGVSVEPVPEDDGGRLSLEALDAMLDDRVRLVALGHVGTNSGTVQPVAEVGILLLDTPAVYLVDACQSLGQLPVNVGDIGCDILTSTGRKYLRGPRGTGFLYIRKPLLERLEPPFPDVRGAELGPEGAIQFSPSGRRFETWEFNYAAKLGLAAAAEYALDIGIDTITDWITERAMQLRTVLAAVDGVEVLESPTERSGLATFALDDLVAERAVQLLRAERINVSVSHLTDTPARRAPDGRTEWLRASAHYFNSFEEIEILAAALARR